MKYKHLLFGNSCNFISFHSIFQSFIILWKKLHLSVFVQNWFVKHMHELYMLYASPYPKNIAVSSYAFEKTYHQLEKEELFKMSKKYGWPLVTGFFGVFTGS